MKMVKIQLNVNEVLHNSETLLHIVTDEDSLKAIRRVLDEAAYGFDFHLINEILYAAQHLNSLTWIKTRINRCIYCDKTFDYVRYARTGLYHNKGDKNLSKPIKYDAYRFYPNGKASITQLGNICTDCVNKYNVLHTVIDYILDHDLPVDIQKNDYRPTKYKKVHYVKCSSCKSEIRADKLTSLYSLCPVCGDNARFIHLDKYEMKRINNE